MENDMQITDQFQDSSRVFQQNWPIPVVGYKADQSFDGAARKEEADLQFADWDTLT